MSDAIDLESINNAAVRNGRSLLESLIPSGKFRGLEYIVRNPRRDNSAGLVPCSSSASERITAGVRAPVLRSI
jgi:hypothetical protein